MSFFLRPGWQIQFLEVGLKSSYRAAFKLHCDKRNSTAD
jgi:hypothetical protein